MTLTTDEVARAIYIDFEGTKTDPASMLGVFCEGRWTAIVIESRLHSAARTSVSHGEVVVGERVEVLRELMNRSIDEGRRIVAWSSREEKEILSYDLWSEEEAAWWKTSVVNALLLGKRWANREAIRIPVIPSAIQGKPNKWSLEGFRIATGYPRVPLRYRSGRTAANIRHLRARIEKHGTYSKVEPLAKRRWSDVLIHNYHDCAGLAHVVSVVGG